MVVVEVVVEVNGVFSGNAVVDVEVIDCFNESSAERLIISYSIDLNIVAFLIVGFEFSIAAELTNSMIRKINIEQLTKYMATMARKTGDTQEIKFTFGLD